MNALHFIFKAVLLSLLLFISLGSICKKEQISIKEARGLWLTRWEWAVKADTNQKEIQKQKIADVFEKATQAKLNFILFQIRGNADAFYQSNYEPWSHLLSGELGGDPGWDPLTYAIDQAHRRGLELHVWFNTFPAWRGTEPPPHTEPEHVLNAHPEWLVCDNAGKPMPLNSHYVSLSPGIPEVREYLHKVAMDIVRNYDIDGFHFDYIRYPENSHNMGYSHDTVSVRMFQSKEGNPHNLSWEDWQRENINIFVRKFYDEATDLKPWLKVSAAVIGKYDYSAWNGYHVVFQDARKWLDEGKMDFIAPMIYWQTNHPAAPFGDITRDWLNNFVRDRFIFPGMAINQLGTDAWHLNEVVKQVSAMRDANGNGMVFFSSGGLDRAASSLTKENRFPYLANFPPMPWKDDQPPMDPANLTAEYTFTGLVKLTWDAPDSSMEPVDVRCYNIFRAKDTPSQKKRAEHLYQIVTAPDTVFFDAGVIPGRTYFYTVAALDRVNNESPPSNEVYITIPQLASR